MTPLLFPSPWGDETARARQRRSKASEAEKVSRGGSGCPNTAAGQGKRLIRHCEEFARPEDAERARAIATMDALFRALGYDVHVVDGVELKQEGGDQ